MTGDVCFDQAIANIAAFVEELDMEDPSVAVTMRLSEHDETGRYLFKLHRGICTVNVAMPSVPLDEVRCSETFIPPRCPRLYVDGNSWWWCYALDTARSALEDHDGAIEQRTIASQLAANAELDRQPRCVTCSSVRSLVITRADLYETRCYTCDPQIETRRETPMGAVYGDDGWKHVAHYLVKRQHLPPDVPGHRNPMHPDALCGARLDLNGRCRLRSRHEGRCEPYWKELERTLMTPDQLNALSSEEQQEFS